MQQASLNEQPRGYARDIAVAVPAGVGAAVGSIVNTATEIGNSMGLIDDPDPVVQKTGTTTLPGELTKVVAQVATGELLLGRPVAKLGGAAGLGTKAQHTLSAAAIDFAAFDAHMGRLSDIIEKHAPSLSNPITEYLASDPNDNFAEARLKNALEGAGIGYAVGSVFNLFKAKKLAGNDPAKLQEFLFKDRDWASNEKAQALRTQIKTATPNVSDPQVDLFFNLIAHGFEQNGETAEQALNHIEKVYMLGDKGPIFDLAQKWAKGGLAHEEEAKQAMRDIQDYLSENPYGAQPAKTGEGVSDPLQVAPPPKPADPIAPRDERIPLENAPAKSDAIPVENAPSVNRNGDAIPLEGNTTQKPTENPVLSVGPKDNPDRLRPASDEIPLKSEHTPDPNAIPLEPGTVTDKVITKGTITFVNDLQAIIGLHNTADFSTLLHEGFHLFRKFNIGGELEDGLKKALNLPEDFKWWNGAGKISDVQRAADEQAARLFERWWADGVAPHEQLAKPFQQTKEWMLAIYKQIGNSEIGSPVSQEVRSEFEKMLGIENGNAAVDPSTPALKQESDRAAAQAFYAKNPAYSLAQKQGKPLSDATVAKIATSVSEGLKAGKTLDAAIRGVDAFINLSKANANTDVLGVIQQIQDALAPEIAKATPSMSHEQSLSIANAIARELNTSDGTALKFLKSQSKQLDGLATRVLAGRVVRLNLAENFIASSKRAADNPLASGLRRQADQRFAALVQAQAFTKETQKAVAQTLDSFKIVVSDIGRPDHFEPLVRWLKAEPTSSINRYQIYKYFAAAGDGDSLRTMVGRFNDALDGYVKKGLNIHDEIFINGLLSGPRTHITNFVSQSLMTLLQPAEQITGKILSGDLAGAKQGFKLYANLMGSVTDIFRVLQGGMELNDTAFGQAWKAFKKATPLLTETGKFERPGYAISAKNLGLEANSIHARAVDYLGHAINLPTRFLTGADEFFKQINYRAFLRNEALNAAEHAGVRTPQELNDFVENFIKEGFDDAGRGRYSVGLLMAKRSTFTQDLTGNLGKWLQEGSSNNSLVRNIIPFVRVPLNILKTFRDYTPGLNMLFRDYREEFTHVIPEIAASARGRMALGAGFWTVAAGAAISGSITGNGPTDPQAKQQLLDSGWQPNSFVINNADGSKTYLSYKRLEPFAMMLGLAADYAEASQYLDPETKDAAAAAFVLPLARNLINKTYLKGLADITSALTDGTSASKLVRLTQMRAKSEIPFSGFLSNVEDDPYMRESRSWFDGVLMNVPGYGKDLPPKRNLFGRPVENPYGINPFTETKQLPSTVQNELANLRYGYSKPSPDFRGNIDLRTIHNAQGREAYDRWQELHGTVTIGGKVMEQSLSDLIQSPRYQAMPQPRYMGDQDNPRVQAVQQVISRYREKALSQTLKEFPTILQQYKDQRKEQIAQRVPQALQRLVQK